MAKTPIDKLDSEIKKILDEYAEEINQGTGEAVKAVGKKGAKAVRNSAASLFRGNNYASGWTYQVDTTRLSTTVTIYNKTRPGLAHLLEKGHAKTGGGRVDGRPHIAPVEEEITKEFEGKIADVIEGN